MIFETGWMGNIVVVGLAVYGSVYLGFDAAKDLTDYISLNSDYINTAIKATGMIGGFVGGSSIELIIGSCLPGGKVRTFAYRVGK